MRRIGLIGTALVLMLALGCARQPLQPQEDWSAQRDQLRALSHWQLQGKLGLRLPDDGGSARLRWDQRGEHYRIDLSGPLGQGRTRVETTEEGVQLHRGGETLTAADAETLLWRATGWRLPIASLVYWVRALPAPQSEHRITEHTLAGLPARMEQLGWQLDYSDYRRVEGLPLPGRIVARRDDLRLTLVVHQWTPRP